MKNPYSVPPHDGREMIRRAVAVIAMLLVLLVNREFGVADNGDFSRYMAYFASKPTELAENWPAQHTEEWHFRFFTQPIFFWSPPLKETGDVWFTATSTLWAIGKKLNDYLYSERVFNLRYVGLPFFLIHTLALLYLFRSINLRNVAGVIVLVGGFFLFTDARITAFYNSLYAESLPVLAIFLLSAFFLEQIYHDQDRRTSPFQRRAFGVLAFSALLLAALSKRQYLYLVAPAAMFAYYLISSETRSSQRKFRFILIACISPLLAGAIYFGVFNRTNHIGETNASRVTSYHALYYGLLPHSEDQSQLLLKLGLPTDSITLIGKSAWSQASQTLIADEEKINLMTFLKAAYLDPNAFIKSVIHNSKEAGNFAIPLGMVHGTQSASPPLVLSVVTEVATKASGLKLLVSGLVLAIIFIFFPCSQNQDTRYSCRTFCLILFSTVVFDLAVSAFDGQQEARKHVIISSLALVVVLLHAIAGSMCTWMQHKTEGT